MGKRQRSLRGGAVIPDQPDKILFRNCRGCLERADSGRYLKTITCRLYSFGQIRACMALAGEEEFEVSERRACERSKAQDAIVQSVEESL